MVIFNIYKYKPIKCQQHRDQVQKNIFVENMIIEKNSSKEGEQCMANTNGMQRCKNKPQKDSHFCNKATISTKFSIKKKMKNLKIMSSNSKMIKVLKI